MSKRPSNTVLKAFIAIAAILGFYILGNWLIKIQRNNSESDITDDISQLKPEASSRIMSEDIIREEWFLSALDVLSRLQYEFGIYVLKDA